MPGLWSAVREEGFRRLSARLAQLRPTADSVQVVGVRAPPTSRRTRYAKPDLYRTMFDQRYVLATP